MTKDEKIAELLEAIDFEKRQQNPSTKKMRIALSKIRHLKWEDDYRNTYTGQDARFLTHTSMRTFRDDC